MTEIFTSEAAKEGLEAFYERFRARIPDAHGAHGAHGRWVPTRFGDTHVLVAGRPDGPPLILLHGAVTSSAHMMSACAPLLDHFRVYAPDIVGQSVKTTDARIPYGGSECGEWLVDVMDALGLARAHVYGASLGGFMAHRLAAYAPDRVDRMVLAVPAGIITNSTFTILSKFMLPMWTYRVFPTRERLRRFLSTMMTDGDDVWVDYFAAAFPAFRLDMRMPPLAAPEDLARFTRPTLVFGASDDIFFPGAKLLARARVLFPHAETELLEGCLHVLPMDAASAEKHRARIVRFLAGC